MSINVENLTIAEVRQIAALAAGFSGPVAASAHTSPHVGKFVVVRTYSAGVHAGILVSQNGDIVELRDSRRLWKWKAVSGVSLSGVATAGIVANESKVEPVLPALTLTGAIEIIPASDAARRSIENA